MIDDVLIHLEITFYLVQIFVHGGYSSDLSTTVDLLGSVYVLSLPSFVWHKRADAPAYGRYWHTCNLVGKRQMLVNGGTIVDPRVDEAVTDTDSLSTLDPWPQGIGIFDLSAMEWREEYNPSADSYVTPDVVKASLRANGPYPFTWSNPTVESWFGQSRSTAGFNGSANFSRPS